MKHIYKLFLSLLVISAAISCSKDDSPETTPGETNGGTVFTNQIVTINLPETTLSQDVYEGKLGPYVTFFEKTGEHHLSFIVVNNVSPGVLDLVIPSLGVNIAYEIKITTLDASPEQTIAPLLSNLTSFGQTLSESTSPEAENMENALEQFNNYLGNASAEDKEQIALAYKANKGRIDQIILEDFSNVTGRLTHSDKLTLTKFLVALLSIDVGATLATRGWHPGVRALGVVIAGIAATKTVDYYLQFIEVEAREMGIMIYSLSGENDRNANDNGLEFNSDVSSVMPISTSKRKVTTEDASSTIESVSDFFEARNTYNTIVGKVNNAIQFVNTNIPFLSFGFFATADLADSAPLSQLPASEEIFNNFTFSVNHPNLSLEQVTLESDGQIALKIKIIGTPAQLPVQSTLKYTYTDDFNNYSGSFPITVNSENPLVGTWTMVSFKNGTPVGDFIYTYYPNCPEIWSYKESETGTFTFTENNFNFVWNNLIVHPNFSFDPDTCVIGQDNPDTTTEDVETGDGTYSFNGTSYILSYTGGEQDVIEWITPDRIKIFDQEYVRN